MIALIFTILALTLFIGRQEFAEMIAALMERFSK
jgi:hypothetical protein